MIEQECQKEIPILLLTMLQKSIKIGKKDNNIEGECSRICFPARESLPPAESRLRVQMYVEVRHRSCF